MAHSSHASLPRPGPRCTCNFFTIKIPPSRLPLKKPSFVFQGNSGKRKGGGNDIFDFPHNPDVGKKKDFLWAAATTLIFYADKRVPSLKKKVMGKIIPLQLHLL